MIPICEPYLAGNEKKYVNECLDTNWISSQGEFIQKFEQSFAEYHHSKEAIATSNCTTALHLALKAFDVGPGDEVICPALTFIAPANMIVLTGAKLVLVDVDPVTLTIAPEKIEEKITENTKAIIVVHQFGHAAHMDEIMSLARKHDLKVIEDNAESIGGKYKGKLLGTIGDLSTFSFFANKIMTTGEGGAIVTDDSKLALKMRELKDHGMSHKKKYDHIALGYNYRMTNMQAAVGLAQLENLSKILAMRKANMDIYYELLKDVHGITLRAFEDWCEPVHWMMTMTIDSKYERDGFLNYMRDFGVDGRQMINPVHWAKHFRDDFAESDFSNAINASKHSVHLPSSTGLTKEQIEFVVKNIINFTKTFG